MKTQWMFKQRFNAWKQKSTLARRLARDIAITLPLVGGFIWMLLSQMNGVLTSQQQLARQAALQGSLQGLHFSLAEMERGMRGFAVSGSSKFLDDYELGKREFARTMENLQAEYTNRPVVRVRLEEIDRRFQSWCDGPVFDMISARTKCLSGLVKDTEFQVLFNKDEGREMVDSIRSLLALLQNRERMMLEEQTFREEARLKLLKPLIFCGLVATVIIGIFLTMRSGMNISRELFLCRNDLNSEADALGNVAEQVMESSMSVARHAELQSEALHKTRDSLEQVSSMNRQNSDGARQTSDLVGQARVLAETGSRETDAMHAAMESINKAGQEVVQITRIVDEIAFQTQILALNAAIEAARAGQAGAGFAVVAEEVRTLSKRSAAAAQETSEKLQTMLCCTRQGSVISSQIMGRLKEIVGKIKQVDSIAAEVAMACREQDSGLLAVCKDIHSMNEHTRSNASSAEASLASSNKLNEQAITVRQTIGRLEKILA